jgi:hypothetical protein
LGAVAISAIAIIAPTASTPTAVIPRTMNDSVRFRFSSGTKESHSKASRSFYPATPQQARDGEALRQYASNQPFALANDELLTRSLTHQCVSA